MKKREQDVFLPKPFPPLTDTPDRLQAKKHFGQHFLVQPNVIQGILKSALSVPSERILEIGPGAGALTKGLLEDGRPLWALELDQEAIAYLSQHFGHHGHFHLLQGNAVHAPLPNGPPWTVVSNLPYNAATPIFSRFLLEPLPWDRLTLMFQWEVAQKIMGQVGEKSYGPLAVLAQLCCHPQRLFKLGPGAFRPAPKVDSAVLVFEPRQGAPDLPTRHALLTLLHKSFAHRRKTLINNWQGWLSPDTIPQILDQVRLAPTIRAEAVPVSLWLPLLALTQQHTSPQDAP